ncbi:cyclodeaminase/cyclohydrolase family protein [Clostridium tunisiense]|uniref:cyclodeaminase/cyclohydrolase family protein n=1 Tax=Clostridium tunisiense TaxID=219748 RepID=UPI0002EA644F|nr:cyclodeaminase/cyclohydrolase family protein [Clostridium tunisiense]
MLDNKTVREFVEELGSNSPAPGGGSVAALASSLASALSAMVFNLTVGKKAYASLNDEEKALVDKHLEITDKSKDEFLDLMNKDVEAFNSVMAAFKLPKETEEEKAIRSEKIQEGYKGAIAIPLEVARKTFNLYDSILVSVKYGNKNAISDGGVAALMTQSAIEGAILNVKINLSSIKDEEYKTAMEKEIERLSNEGLKRKEEILTIVKENM